MSNILSRRKLITTGLATAAGASGLAIAAVLAKRYGLIRLTIAACTAWGNPDVRFPAALDVPPFACSRVQP